MNVINKLLFLFTAAIVMSACTTEPEKISKPNILFIVVDDLGYSDLSCMGSEYYETPNIDKIAANGVNFTNGYAACAVCSPSRASLLTGKFTARHGITEYIGAPYGEDWRSMERHTRLLPPAYKPFLNHDDVTWPEALKESGYHTFFAGKWHLGGEKDNSLPTHHGFDINKGGFHQGGPYTGGYFSPFNNPYLTDYPDEKGMSLSMKLANETKAFIEQHKDSNFLAYLSFYAVHGPIQTTKEKWTKYRNKADSIGIAPKGFEMERILPYRKHQDNPVYAGLVEQVDEAIGSVMQTLEDLGVAQNTMIVFTSDNGGVVSGDNYSTNSLHLRGGKGYQWEGGIRVPYFIYVPWLDENGVTNSTPVTGADLYPTILELAGLPPKPEEHQDGVSLVPLLQGDTISSRPLYWHYPHYGNQGGEPHAIIREGDYKLIHYWEDGRDELYNLTEDIGETKDLSAQEQLLTTQMRNKLLNWLQSVNARYATPDSLYNEKAHHAVLERYRTQLYQRLEKQRTQMLSPNWRPNDDWWGSE
ncbi:sulfatase [Carboxylicivirga taeanensis]|uniref:sulfatase n=1 Tax=Carboxylicivirga taeanensis TaxID=1416875 RepID=UPI003F6DA628